MLGPNIPISLNFLLFLLFSINIYYLVTILLTHLLPDLIFSSYKLKIIKHKYQTKSIWKLTLRLLSLFYLDIWYTCETVNKSLPPRPMAESNRKEDVLEDGSTLKN